MPRSPNQGPRSAQGRGPRGSGVTRRAVISGAALAGVGVGVGLDRILVSSDASEQSPQAAAGDAIVPFHGEHQAGIATPPQAHLSFAAFDLTTRSRTALRSLLQRWSAAAASITAGRQYEPSRPSPKQPPIDPGETLGLASARLTLTVGFGPTLFDQGGRDRFGLAHRKPPLLAPLPHFSGEMLQPESSGGDLCVQACAEDPQTTFHAVHLLAMLAASDARLRWMQVGFQTQPSGDAGTGRNLIGFKDGTRNISTDDSAAMKRFVWVGRNEGPRWMEGGSYLVARRVEIVFSAWDGLTLIEQERAIGRHKDSGAPLGAGHEHDPVNLAATDARGDPMIPIDAHVRIAAAASNRGTRILRRGYSFSRGATPGPVDRGGHQIDGGLFFIAFTRDLTRFAELQRRVISRDALNGFTLHTASAVFAVPPGAQPGGYVGEGLFA
jgi:deferrochelatase/peroxidase EfeB